MSRFLFVVPPLTGHVNPTVSVGAALRARGHEVAWVAHPGRVRPLVGEDARIFPLDENVSADRVERVTARANAARGLSALKILWEDFLLPLARATLPEVEAAMDDYAPDVAIVDQQTIAGAIAARRLDLPWATFATTSAGVTDPLAGLPRVKAWLDGHLAALETEAGLPNLPAPDISPHLVVVFSTEALVGDGPWPARFAFVGPAVGGRPARGDFPFDALEADRKKVLVSLGTVNRERGERFYRTVIEALGGTEIQVVLVAPADLAPTIPANVLRRDWVPQVAVLPKVDAVVSHAGHNTVCEALLFGKPLVVTPVKDDQPVVAEQVVRSGAGLRLKFGRMQPAALRRAVHQVLETPAYREAAGRVKASFAAAGGADAAAARLEALAESGGGA